MAFEVGMTKDELVLMARRLGVFEEVIPSGKGDKIMKDDIVPVIRRVNLIKRYGAVDAMPVHLAMMLQIKSPMLAVRIDSLKEEQQRMVWESEDFEFEEKINGVRCFVVYDGESIQLYSRHNSDVDLLPVNFTEKIVFPAGFDVQALDGRPFILDTEMTSDVANLSTIIDKYGVVTETVLQAVTSLLSSDNERARMIQVNEGIHLAFNAFDCLYYGGEWLLSEPLSVRRDMADIAIESLLGSGFNVRTVRRLDPDGDKKKFFREILQNNGEGVIAKRISGIYNADSTRGFKQGWIKIKRSVGTSLEMENEFYGDTIDAFISGYTEGGSGTVFENYIGSVCVSLYLRKKDGSVVEHEIGRFSGIPMSLREEMTELINGMPTLKPSFYGKVVEIDGQGISARERRLNHCQFLGFRYDKMKDSCVMDEDFLESQIM